LVAANLTELAKLYFQLSDYAKAEQRYERALAIIQTTRGPNYYKLAEILTDLAKIYAIQGKPAEAIASQTRANSIIEYNLALNLAIGSERQKKAYVSKLPEQMDQSVSLHARYASADEAAIELAATTILQRKGRVLDSVSASYEAVRSRSNPADRQLWDQLNDTTRELARVALTDSFKGTPLERQQQIKSLEQQRENLEAQIGSRSVEFYASSQPVTLARVRDAIPDDAALIEIAVYRPVEFKVLSGSRQTVEPRYIAYVLRKKGELHWLESSTKK
jgi:tetratricopeptide (TPR) repeat protein